MRVLLANPLFEYKVPSYPVHLIELASYVKAHGFEDIYVIDLNLETYHTLDPDEKFRQAVSLIAELDPDIIGFSCMTIQVPACIKLSRMLRRFTSSTIVLGGIHATQRYDQMFDLCEVDFIVRGEGEVTFVELLRELNAKDLPARFKSISGLAFRDSGKVLATPAQPLIKDLSTLPQPDFDLFDFDRYFHSIQDDKALTRVERFLFGRQNSERGRETPMLKRSCCVVASRGCPYHCIFCSTSEIWKYQRRKPVNRIKAEIEYFKERFDCQYVDFHDDLINLNIMWLDQLLEMLASLNMEWFARARLDALTKKTISKMARAGCVRIYHGLESGSMKVRNIVNKQYRKTFTNDKAFELVRHEVKEGLTSVCSFMVGVPGETREDMLETITMARKLHKNGTEVQFWIMTPYPGTPAVVKFKDKLKYLNRWKTFRQRDVFDIPQVLLFHDVLDELGEENPDQYIFLPDMDLEEFKTLYREGRMLVGLESVDAGMMHLWGYFADFPAGFTFVDFQGALPTARCVSEFQSSKTKVLLMTFRDGKDFAELGLLENLGVDTPLEKLFVSFDFEPTAKTSDFVRKTLAQLRRFRERHVNVEILFTKPLFDAGRIEYQECFKVPHSCLDCLEMFYVDEHQRVRFCHGAIRGKIFDMQNRNQLFELFSVSMPKEKDRMPHCYDPEKCERLLGGTIDLSASSDKIEVTRNGLNTLVYRMNWQEIEIGDLVPIKLLSETISKPMLDYGFFDTNAPGQSRFLNIHFPAKKPTFEDLSARIDGRSVIFQKSRLDSIVVPNSILALLVNCSDRPLGACVSDGVSEVRGSSADIMIKILKRFLNLGVIQIYNR